MISNITFIFLVEHLMSHLFHVHGISNAFVVRFKLSRETQSLVLLNNDSFKCFPDMDVQYQRIWKDARNYGAFSAAMAHLRDYFHTKQLTCTFPLSSPIIFLIIYRIVEYKMKNVQFQSLSAELKLAFYIGWCHLIMLSLLQTRFTKSYRIPNQITCHYGYFWN